MMDPMAANNLRASQIKLENAVKKEISQSFRRSDHIADTLARRKSSAKGSQGDRDSIVEEQRNQVASHFVDGVVDFGDQRSRSNTLINKVNKPND